MESWPFQLDHLIILLFFMSLQFQLSIESDSIIPGETVSGNHTLTSQGEVFEMGFFAPPGNSHDYYIGIWYKGLPTPQKTVVWVANRDSPVSDPYSSWLELGQDGHLVLLTSSGLTVWSTNSNSSAPPSNSTVGTLGDDGNFIIRERSNPFLAKEEREIWQSFDYPTDTWLPGAKFGYDKDTGIKTILNSWQDTSNPSMGLSAEVIEIHPDRNLREVQLMLKSGSESKFYTWAETNYDHVDFEDQFAFGCFWNDYSDNYVVMTYSTYPTPCFARYMLDVSGQLKLFVWWSYMETWQAINVQVQTCESHSENKNDTRIKANESGKKNATWIVSPSGNKNDKKINAKESGKKKATRIIIATSAGLALLFVGITVLLRIAKRKDSGTSFKTREGDTLTQYKLRDLRRATKNFTQKIGKGGFSTVYKGEFPDSTLIAVKELHAQLREEKQLRAELNTLGLIQHKNLVRLLGFCLEDSKRFIVYDYMPNGSLESHLFQKGSNILDWETRYRIAVGTAKGLAYIHEECRDCIIHCDIKPENILLDAEYNPQVADFGLAKLLGRNFSRVLTTMRGTRGYLAPEWFSGEAVTAKVDVYSYGQVLFEIISGRRTMDLLNNELNSYFPAMIFNALNNGLDLLPLVDSKLEGELNMEELSRACKVACWCIQDNEKDRPNMIQVVQILEGLVDVGIPPIPWFFQSIAEPSMNESDIKGSEAYSTSSTLPTSFTFQPPAQPIQHIP